MIESTSSDREMSTGRSLLYEIEPRLGWEDLFFPSEVRRQIEALIYRWRHRARIFGAWGQARRRKSRGIAALFSGEPGTGKSEAASLVAAELGLRLFQVSTAALLSKYIGETYPLSGGAIQNIATNACYLACARGLEVVDRAALKEALADELDKLGILVQARD
jgi:hypothetical protein